MSPAVFLYANLILFSMSVAPIFMKKLSISLSAFQIAFSISLVTLLISGSIIIAQNNLSNSIKALFDLKILLLVFVIGVFAFIDLYAYGSALQKGANIGVLLSYVRAGGTVLTALLAIYFLGDKLTAIQWSGVFVCVLGITLILAKSN